jgi:hydrogenase/urease accessory protein HupE
LKSSVRSLQLVWFALPTLWPLAARAHGDLERLGPFYAGALHPLLVPAHLVALLALGLLVGQRGLKPNRHALTMLLLTLATGLGVAAAATDPFAWATALERLLLPVAALAALATLSVVPLPRVAPIALAGVVGLGIGLGSAPEVRSAVPVATLGPAWMTWSTVAGTLLGAFVTTALVAAVVDGAHAHWARLATRIAASWLAASAMLVFALAYVGRAS